MNHVNIEGVIVAYADDLTVHLVREGTNCLVFSDAGKLETVGQGLMLSETEHIRAKLFEIDGKLAGIDVQYPGYVVNSIPFIIKPKLLELLIKIAKSPFSTFHTHYIGSTETGRNELRKIIASFSVDGFRAYKPIDGMKILNAIRLYIIVGDYEGFMGVVGEDLKFYELLDVNVYTNIAKRAIEVIYGKFEAPFSTDFNTFPIEVAQPYPTEAIQKWMQDNQIDMKVGLWSDSTPHS